MGSDCINSRSLLIFLLSNQRLVSSVSQYKFYFEYIFLFANSEDPERLIWVCTVCLCPKNGMLGLYGLSNVSK